MSAQSPKRLVSALIPYRREGEKLLVFLQRRSKDAKRSPDWFGFFGGGIENGETPEEALEREILEELCFEPIGYKYLNVYETPNSVNSVYYLEVGNDFEKRIEVREGQYGKFFTETEVLNEPKFRDHNKTILRELFNKLRVEQ